MTVTYSLKCNNVVTAYDTDCTVGQTEIRYISVTLVDTYTPMFNMHFGTNSDGKYILTATAGVRVH